ncbi:MAG: alpha-1,4-glucan--maltose-1-phosphate maltosyltransferase [Bryobacterales bacterium]|nr:alpha-1,4-glucan--maltose-1-phosphate maltosyltransferase [Bryobacterales bacterium]
MESVDGRRRVVIEAVEPQVDAGRFAIKRVAGETVQVAVDLFGDGHDAVAGAVLYRHESRREWSSTPLRPLVNDRWEAEFRVEETGAHLYTIEGWVDHFLTWQRDLRKRLQAGSETEVDFLIGADLVEAASLRAPSEDAARLREWANALRERLDAASALDETLTAIVLRYPDRTLASRYERELRIVVDRPRAGFSAWYEIFPRSCSFTPGVHGTFADCARRLPEIAAMGFDVVYLPPVHPVGRLYRKGKNNSTVAQPDDVGSPWAIGAEEGGHKAIHPQLGTLDDFRAFVAEAREAGLETALDIAFQCAPDHPWVRDHPQWFRARPDGSIQYAENPPKKYQDIYPLDFETSDWRALWEGLKSVFLHWAAEGVRIFRVDNPHTKPFAFWEWVIAEVKRQYPDVLFLSEAFTRPKLMYRLAKVGFTQSYTYFSWRNTKAELTEYFHELTATPVREFFRPNAWPNTPDILPEFLQIGGRPAFMIRHALAATLAANYGIYGPAFELCENEPRERGSEEYLHSEKYEIRQRDWDAPWSLKDYIARINHIRRENPALHADRRLRFHPTDNDMLLCYSKTTEDMTNVIVVVVNLDFRYRHSGWVHLDLDALGVEAEHPFQVHDLLGGGRYLWQGSRNYVELDSHSLPAHIFRVRRRVRTEADFDYYL